MDVDVPLHRYYDWEGYGSRHAQMMYVYMVQQAKFNDRTMTLIPHPTRGTGNDQRIGNFYTRIKTTLRWTLKIIASDIVRVLVVKYKDQVKPGEVYLWQSNSPLVPDYLNILPLADSAYYSWEVLMDRWYSKSNMYEFQMDEFVIRERSQINATTDADKIGLFIFKYVPESVDNPPPPPPPVEGRAESFWTMFYDIYFEP